MHPHILVSSYCGCSCCSNLHSATGSNTVSQSASQDWTNTTLLYCNIHAGFALLYPKSFAGTMEALAFMTWTKSRSWCCAVFPSLSCRPWGLDVHPGMRMYAFGAGGASSGTGGPGTREEGYNGGHLAGSWHPVSIAFASNFASLRSS